MSLLERFAEAFNRGDRAALGKLLAADATAQVLGAPFPEEQGAEVIERTSFAHLLDPEAALGASVARVEDADGILLCGDEGEGPLDTAIRITCRDDRIQRLEYIVAPHEPERLQAVGQAHGLRVMAT